MRVIVCVCVRASVYVCVCVCGFVQLCEKLMPTQTLVVWVLEMGGSILGARVSLNVSVCVCVCVTRVRAPT